MTYKISKIASILGIKNVELIESEISTLLTDSRKLSGSPSHTLFFALETKNNDGHTFINELYSAGVRNFVVSKRLPEWDNLPGSNFLHVKNTLRALQKLAAYHRSRFDIPIIGITGSNGKTVVKEWLYRLLQENFNIVRSPRSYNSQVGVPLSVWELDDTTELGIFEAGISMPDEMGYLEPIIRPTIGILTKIGEAHQENFTSLQQKCMEKMALFVNSNVVIYDEDNDLINRCADMMLLSQKAFSWSRKRSEAPLYISKIDIQDKKTAIHYSFLRFEHSVDIPFTDEASIENAIHCLAVLLFLGIHPREISKRMMTLEPVAMRLDVRQGKNDCIIINDAYNSDINSIKIALDFQNQRKMDRPMKKTVILSDILQTGIMPKSLYKRVAEMVEQSGVDKLIGIGHDISENAGAFKMEKQFFPSTEAFIQSGIWRNFDNELILVKGAREYHFEQITALIEERIHETVLEVDLDAVVHNFNFYKSKLSPGVKMICMVKANGYGAGAVEIAKTLQYHRCDYLAVAVAEEGLALRSAGISLPIIILNPEVNGFEELFSNDLEPEVFYDRKDDLFYIIWASTVPGKFPEIPTSESEKGLNHRLYFVTTKDFKTFSETKLFFDPGFSVIDGAIVKNGRKYWMIVKNENSAPPEKNLRITFTDDLKKGFPTQVSKSISGKSWAEGPSPIKIGKYVYVYFDKYREGKYGAIRSTDGKHWEDVSDLVSFPSGTRHGTAFKITEKEFEKVKKTFEK
jgi:UDP-N-acetylmuramoyl-tripeptide--D-alanyl-D-alanine ligase